MIRLHSWPHDAAAIERAWREVEERASGVLHYQRFEWFASTARLSPPERGPILVAVVERGGHPSAVLGLRLARGRLGFPRILELLRDDHPMADWTAESGVGGEQAVDLVRGLRRDPGVSWDVLTLSKLPEESTLLLGLRGAPVDHLDWRWTDHRHRIDLPGSWAELEERLPRKLRRDLRVGLRRLQEELGDPRFSSCSGTSPEVVLAARRFAELESSGWKAGAGGGILGSDRGWQVFQDRVATLGRLGVLRLNFLEAGDQLVAAQFCAVEQGEAFFLKTGYAERHSRAGPGHLHLEWLARWGIDSGLRRIDLVSGAEWPLKWRPSAGLLATAHVYRDGIRAGISRMARRRPVEEAWEECDCGVAARLNRADPGGPPAPVGWSRNLGPGEG